MKDVKKVFKNLEEILRSSSWFNDGWEIYNRGPYLQLYREDWFNQNQGGVHFETFIEANQVRDKIFPIAMHAEEDCPSQERFVQQFIELEGGRISSWKGYKAVGEGYTICERRRRSTSRISSNASLKSSIDFESSKKVSRPPSMNLASKGTMNG